MAIEHKVHKRTSVNQGERLCIVGRTVVEGNEKAGSREQGAGRREKLKKTEKSLIQRKHFYHQFTHIVSHSTKPN